MLPAWVALIVLAGSGNAMQVAKIRVSLTGDIVIDGHAATMQQLAETLAKEKQQSGEIWYYRESPSTEPSAAQIRVFTRIVDSGLHISLSTRPDFSDWVDEQGTSNPRGP